MAAMNTYRVTVAREGTAWLATAADVPGVHTWEHDLTALDRSIREAIAGIEDLPDGAEADMSLDYDFRPGDSEPALRR
jgi:hypothetical protein